MNRKLKNEITEWIKTIGKAVIIAMGVTLLAQPTRVDGQSMYPTLEHKDILLVNKLAYKSEVPDRGDIIIFNTDLMDMKTNKNKVLVKRVIGLPNEHLVIKENKVYINDEYMAEDYLSGVYTEGNIDLIIPKNQVFVMGDNRENSDDSRKTYIGTISVEDIVGKAFIRVYPFNKAGQIE